MRTQPRLITMTLFFAGVLVAQRPDNYLPSLAVGGGTNTGSVVSPTDAALAYGASVAYDPSGNLYTVEWGLETPQVRKFGADNELRTISTAPYLPLPQSLTCPPNIQAQGLCQFPGSVTVRSDSTPVFALVGPTLLPSIAYNILALTPSGTFTAVAGTGKRGFADGAAAAAQFAEISALAADGAGNIYVADGGNFRIREITASGAVTTLAGTGASGGQGDGGPATAAEVAPVGGMAFVGGALYFTQPTLHTVRRIRADGIMETVAGNGSGGKLQDGAAATGTLLNSPFFVAGLPNGGVLVTDGNTILAIDTTGKIWTAYDPSWSSDQQSNVIACYQKTGRTDIANYFDLAVDPAGNPVVAAQPGTALNGTAMYRMAPNPILVTAPGTLNAASYDPNLSPGLVFTIFGAGLGPSALVTGTYDANGFLPTQLAGTEVLFDGLPAPLLYVSSDELAGIVPYGAGTEGICSVVQVKQGTTVSPQIAKDFFPDTPALFTLDASGAGPAAAFNQDWTVNGPENPAKTGEVVAFYVTGGGVTTPASVDGQLTIAPALPKPAGAVTVLIGGLPAQVNYAGAAPDLVAGVMQVNAVVPPDTPNGPNVPVEIAVNGDSSDEFSTGAVTIAVQSSVPTNPQPTITGIAPSSVSLMASEANPPILTVNGTGFTAASRVFFGNPSITPTYADAAVPTFVNGTQLTLPVFVEVQGTYAVVVVNPTPGGGTSSSATFTVTAP